MSVERDVRHGVRIGRAGFVRSYRQLVGNRRRLIGIIVMVLAFGVNFLFVLPIVYSLGQTTQSVALIPFFGVATTALPVVLVGLGALRTGQRIGNVEAEELLLMSVHPRAAVLGLLTDEIARQALWIGLPLGAVVTAFGVGLGSPALVVTTGVVLVPLLCCTTVWGYALGIGLLRLFRWLPGLRRLVKVGAILGMLPLVVGSQYVGMALAEGSLSVTGLTFDPLSEYVAIAFVGTRLAQPLTIGGAAVLGSLVVLVPIGFALATKQATVYWFTDSENATSTPAKEGASGGFSAPPPFAWSSAGRMAWGHLLRTARRPQEIAHVLNFLAPLAILPVMFLQFAGDQLGTLLAGFGVILGTYLAGTAFVLNPLGDDHDQLPLLFLTHASPRTLVRSRVVASVAVGVPATVLLALVGFGLGAPLGSVLAFVAVGAVFCLCSALFSVGIGAAQPVYEPQEYWGTETLVPSTVAVIVWLFVGGGGTAIGTVAVWLLVSGTVSFGPLIGGGLFVYGLATIGVPYLSYRYAVRRVCEHTLE